MITLRTVLILTFCSTSFLSGMKVELQPIYQPRQNNTKETNPQILELSSASPAQITRMKELYKKTEAIFCKNVFVPKSFVPELIEVINFFSASKCYNINEDIMSYAIYQQPETKQKAQSSLFFMCLKDYNESLKNITKITPTASQFTNYQTFLTAKATAKELGIPASDTDAFYKKNYNYAHIAVEECSALYKNVTLLHSHTNADDLNKAMIFLHSTPEEIRDMQAELDKNFILPSTAEETKQDLYTKTYNWLSERPDNNRGLLDIFQLINDNNLGLLDIVQLINKAKLKYAINEEILGNFALDQQKSIWIANLDDCISILYKLIAIYNASRGSKQHPLLSQFALYYILTKKCSLNFSSDKCNENDCALKEYYQLINASIKLQKYAKTLYNGSGYKDPALKPDMLAKVLYPQNNKDNK